jgi:hypothetical protein
VELGVVKAVSVEAVLDGKDEERGFFTCSSCVGCAVVGREGG